MDETKIHFNGVNAESGRYLMEPMSMAEFASRAGLLDIGLETLAEPERAVIDHPTDLGEAGWGVIFAADAHPELHRQLAVLLEHRRAQSGCRYRQLTYRRGESNIQFLKRHGAGQGPVNPDALPYYLLIVGDPQAVPFGFQYQLAVQHGVGRLACLTPQDYGRYARAVVEVEQQGSSRQRRVAILATEHPNDEVTAACRRDLAQPLVTDLSKDRADWTVEPWLGEAASKVHLRSLLGGEATPALLFTVGHGLGFDCGDREQIRLQGALLCSEWGGPGKAIEKTDYFGAEDVCGEADLRGMISFHLACFSGGTPEFEALDRRPRSQRVPTAPQDFVARLPQCLLSHPRGGALAVVGHVDRAWGTPILGGEGQLQTFESALKDLVDGKPVGHAMRAFGQRYAEISADLLATMFDGGRLSTEDRVAWWTAYHDARTYTILGDPAVRLPPSTTDL
jgi:hypothetical protein